MLYPLSYEGGEGQRTAPGCSGPARLQPWP